MTGSAPVVGVLAAGAAGAGSYLLYTSVVFGRRELWAGRGTRPRRPSLRERLDRAGLVEVGVGELSAASALLFVVGAVAAYALFGGPLPAVMAGAFAAGFPVSGYRARRRRRLAAARGAWPRMLEELRLLTGSLGRSIPQGLFDVGRRAPRELVAAFGAAEREWLLTTDFPRTLDVLRARLADPTADVVCETLEVAHEVGGGDLDRRLAELVEDRVLDLQGRRDAEAHQSGVRFARRFVLLVPLGMTLAGLSIGAGRSAYQSTGGQVGVAVGLAVVVACWVWSGRLMKLPEEPRIFRVVAEVDPHGGGRATVAGGAGLLVRSGSGSWRGRRW